MIRITLPWPPQPLWPNRSGGKHWAAKDKDRTSAKETGYYATLEALQGHNPPLWLNDPLALVYVVHAPNKIRRDIHDNLPGACKPFVDGAFAALKIDDSQVSGSTTLRREIVKLGAVELIICSLSDMAGVVAEVLK